MIQRVNHWKRPCCWERLRAEGKRGNRWWDGWMAPPTQWTWIWANSRRWRGTEKPGVPQSMGLQRVRRYLTTEQQVFMIRSKSFPSFPHSLLWEDLPQIVGGCPKGTVYRNSYVAELLWKLSEVICILWLVACGLWWMLLSKLCPVATMLQARRKRISAIWFLIHYTISQDILVCILGKISCGSAGKESACNAGDLGLIPGLGRSPGEGKGYPHQ